MRKNIPPGHWSLVAHRVEQPQSDPVPAEIEQSVEPTVSPIVVYAAICAELTVAGEAFQHHYRQHLVAARRRYGLAT